MRAFLSLLTGGVFFLSSPAFAGEDTHIFYEQGIAAYERFSDDQIESAIDFLKKELEKSPRFSPAYSALAEAYIQKYFRSPGGAPQLLEKAALAAEKALFSDARSAPAHKAIASVYFAKGMTDEAMEELERAIDMVPDYGRALLNLGICWLHKGNREKARAFFGEAINAGNDKLARGVAYFNLASLEAEEKMFESSLQKYRKALDFIPDYYNIYYGLGVVLMNLGRDKEAVTAFNESLRLKADYGAAHTGLARAYHRLGDKVSAAMSYEAALAIDPDSEEAKEGLAALSERKIGCLYFY